MLEDAQMQHVQLSKDLGGIIASKDAELAILKGGWHDSYHSSSLSSNMDHISLNVSNDPSFVIKLVQEKLAVENTLKEVQQKYQNSLTISNESTLLSGKYDLLSQRYNHLESEYMKYKEHADGIIQQKIEEIDNIAMEYSKLAADCEIRHSNDTQEKQSIMKENIELSARVESFEAGIQRLVQKIDEIILNPNAPKTFAEKIVGSFLDV